MYLVDFFKRLGRKSNIPVIIYLILNIFIIGGITHAMIGTAYQWNFWLSLLLGIVLYVFSLMIALSPIGEWMLRVQTGCKKIVDQNMLQYLEPLFREVYFRAKRTDPSIPDDVKLFMVDDPSPNAFATGRKTIAVTKGLMNMPADQIKATLGHEFGHLAHKDTDLILVVSVGNMIVTTVILLIRIALNIGNFFTQLLCIFLGGEEGLIGILLTKLSHFLVMVFVSFLTWIWTKIGTLLVMKSSRSNEYEADEFSFRLGYGASLCGLLANFTGHGAQGLFASLASSHPDSEDRIARIHALMQGGAQMGNPQQNPQLGQNMRGFQNPQMGNPNFGGPNPGMGNPNYGGPNPGMGNPNYGGPNPGMGNPNYGGPNPGMGNPNYGGPNQGGPGNYGGFPH